MLKFLEVRFNLIRVQPAQPLLGRETLKHLLGLQPAQPLLGLQPAQPLLGR